MTRTVCRLRLRAGEPLGLSIYPAPTFLSLPPEIRTQIYRLLLVSPEPLTVFPPSRPDLQFCCFTPGLLLLNRAIGAEAAKLLYGYNTFRFEKSSNANPTDDVSATRLYGAIPVDCWDALYSFLLLIGARNRACLHHLEVAISRPRAVSVDAQGTLFSMSADTSASWLRKVHGRDQHPRRYPLVDEESYIGPSVDYISPAIEAVFRLLGPVGLKMQLTLLMEPLFLPLLDISPHGSRSGWSGEVADVIEMLRRRFTCGSDRQPRVEVLWKGLHWKSQFVLRGETLRQDGWDILEESTVIGPVKRFSFGPTSNFTLQRRDVVSDRPPAFFLCDLPWDG